MIAPTARARAAALTGAVVGAAAIASLLGPGTSTAASPPLLRTYGPPTSWTPTPWTPTPWTMAAGTARELSEVGSLSGLLGAAGLPVALSRPPAVPPGPRPSATARPAGPPVGVGPESPLAQVRELQRLLNARLTRAGGHAGALRVDGDWGPATTRAVRRFQAQAGLPVDGQAGPATLAALRNRS